MKKILFVINQICKGGAETALVNLLNSLDYSKYQVDLIVFNNVRMDGVATLMHKVPPEVSLCDPVNKRRRRLTGRLLRMTQSHHLRERFDLEMLSFVSDKAYDAAISYGEWFPPEFVATAVSSKMKAAWIHTDITKAEYFDPDEYFRYNSYIDTYIFASESSRRDALELYTFLEDKSAVIHNMVDEKEIIELSGECVDDFEFVKPTVVTVANVRRAKNHLRQIEVMSRLRKQGVDFCWLNIGNTADGQLMGMINRRIEDCGLADDFILLGARQNPYKYMAKSDIVAVLSDYESWSLSITEAKILGKPVLSTPTSGACEQLDDGNDGVITTFETDDIAKDLKELLLSGSKRRAIAESLSGYSISDKALREFYGLMESADGVEEVKSDKRDTTLYVIDDINYKGGAHAATLNQIKELEKRGLSVEIFTITEPCWEVLNTFRGVKAFKWNNIRGNEIYSSRFLHCMLSGRFTIPEKLLKLRMTLYSKILKKNSFEKYVAKNITDIFDTYGTICVMSEASVFRKAVGKSRAARKIQWVHTDYAAWRESTGWAKSVTENDGELYGDFDRVVFVSEDSRRGFVRLYPHLAGITDVIWNLVPQTQIRDMAMNMNRDMPKFKFITVGRIDKEKNPMRIVRIAEQLSRRGYDFVWIMVGDGPYKLKMEKRIEQLDMDRYFSFSGFQPNPYKYMKDADIFMLLSEYEGIATVVFESMILGVPVLATDVSGVRQQIANGINGWIVDNDEEMIVRRICEILDGPEAIESAKKELEEYRYDNDSIIQSVIKVLKP